MRISDEIVQQVRESNDIIDVLEEYLTFKRNGDNYLALCPFHSEKTPSFVASRKKQIFKCFGCGESGNVISFVMKYKNLNFVESIKFLASKVGIEVDSDVKNNGLDEYYNILVDSAKYFYINLKKNNQIKKYLVDRGLKDSTITKFGLGYSPNFFNSLKKYLLDKGYNIKVLLELGLVNNKNGKYYDKFIDRIIFPIFNYSGRVIGFGGRVINDRLPKYLNSKESVVFKKGSNLYALNFLLKSSKLFDSIIVVEGYMDCIALHNHGITNVVASLGTAFTFEQAKLLSKYTNRIYLCFDGDDAGKNAIIRTFDIFKNFLNQNSLEVYVIQFNGAKDPDEFLNKYGNEKFVDVIKNSKTLVEYIFEFYKEKIDVTTNLGRKKYLNIVKSIIDQLELVDKEYYIKLLSDNLKIKEELIIGYVNKNFKNISDDKYFEIEDKIIEKAHIKAEKQLLNLMLNREYLMYILNNNVDESLFSIDTHKKIFKIIVDFNDEEDEILTYLEKKLNTYEEIKVVTYFKENIMIYDNNNITDQIDDFIKALRKNIISNFKEKITHIIKKYESDADENKFIEYLSMFNMISKLDIEGRLSEAIDFIKSFEV